MKERPEFKPGTPFQSLSERQKTAGRKLMSALLPENTPILSENDKADILKCLPKKYSEDHELFIQNLEACLRLYRIFPVIRDVRKSQIEETPYLKKMKKAFGKFKRDGVEVKVSIKDWEKHICDRLGIDESVAFCHLHKQLDAVFKEIEILERDLKLDKPRPDGRKQDYERELVDAVKTLWNFHFPKAPHSKLARSGREPNTQHGMSPAANVCRIALRIATGVLKEDISRLYDP